MKKELLILESVFVSIFVSFNPWIAKLNLKHFKNFEHVRALLFVSVP